MKDKNIPTEKSQFIDTQLLKAKHIISDRKLTRFFFFCLGKQPQGMSCSLEVNNFKGKQISTCKDICGIEMLTYNLLILYEI